MTRRPRLATLLIAVALLTGILTGPGANASSAHNIRGRYVLNHSDDFANGVATYQPMLELRDGTLLKLDFRTGGRPRLDPGTWIQVRGVRHGDRIAVAGGGARRAAAPDGVLAASGAERVAVVLFNFAGDTSQPYTPEFAQGVAFTNPNSVAAYYAQTSWGQLSLSGDVFGWYTIPDSNSSCSYTTWGNSASQAAAAAGVDLSGYDHVVYAFPSTSSCGWAGMANMPGRYSWLNGSLAMSLQTMAHELGHNFGTHHASQLNCTEGGVRVSLSASSSSCTTGEYGDPYSVMGMGSRYEHTNFARGNIGWLQSANTQAVTSSGEYTVRPIEAYDPGGVQTLLIQRTSSTYLTLEFRQPSGIFDSFPSSSAVVNGVTVRITPGYSTRSQSKLVDATPETTSFYDSALAVGRTLYDPLTSVSITTLSVSGSGATVQIAFGAAPAPSPSPSPSPTTDTTPPNQPATLSASPLDPSRVSLSWSASTDDVGVAGYRVYRNSSLVTTVTGTGYTDAGLSASTTYGYQVIAVDLAGNASTPASTSATTPAPPPPADTQAPTAPTNLRATVGKGNKVALAWTASWDDVGVTWYRIFRNGSIVGTTPSTSFTDSPGGRKVTVTYYVVAYDAAGNASPSSNPVSVRL